MSDKNPPPAARRKPPPPPGFGRRTRSENSPSASDSSEAPVDTGHALRDRLKANAERRKSQGEGRPPLAPVPPMVGSTLPGSLRLPGANGASDTFRGHHQSSVSGEVVVEGSTPSTFPTPPPPLPRSATPPPLPDLDIELVSTPDEHEPEPSQPTVAVPGKGGIRSPTAVLETYAEDARQAIAAYEAELEGDDDLTRVGRLHYEIARLHEGVLANFHRASEHYRQAIEAAPDHLPAVVGARRVMLAQGDHAESLEMFDREIRVTADRRAKAALLFAKARVLEDHLGRIGEARKIYADASELADGDAVLLKALEHAEHQTRAWKGLAEVHQRTANAVGADARHRAALIVRRARLLEVHEHDPDAAAELFEAALGVDPETVGAVDALKRLHHERRRWRELIRVLEREADSSEDTTVRTMALYRIGQIQAERLGNRNEALAVLERAAKETPVQSFVLEALARLYEKAGAQPALARTLGRLVESTRDLHQRLGYLHRIGELCRDALKDDDAAMRAYEAALEIDPSYIPALRALAPMYASKGRWDDLVRMHEAEAQATHESARRANAHARAGEILERIGRRIEATVHHEHALSLDPDLSSSFRALIRLFSHAEEHHKLIELYERALERVDAERQVEYMFAIGDLYRGPLADPEQAEHAYRRVLKLRPNHQGAVHALQRVAEAYARHRELVEALELESRIIKDEREIVALLHRAGVVLHEELDCRTEAVIRFKKVLEIDDHHVPTLAALGRIYHADGHWHDLVDIYRRELDVTPSGPGAVALLHKMGEVHTRFLADPDRAAECFRKALDLDPQYAPSSHALGRILRDQGAWDELVLLTQAECDSLKDAASRALASFRVGEIYEENLDDKNAAAKAYVRSLQLLPNYRPAMDALTRVQTQLEHWRALAEGLESSVDSLPVLAQALTALMRAGEIWWDHLGDAVRAIACYERVLERDATHLAALLAIEPLYRETKAWTKLAALHLRQVQVLRDSGAKAAALRERARVLEAIAEDGPDDLVDCYTQILALRPNDRVALEGLERLAMKSGDPRVLASVDARLADAASTGDLRAAYLTRQAESLETSGQPQALAIYRSALSLDSQSRSAVRGLGRLAEVLGDGQAMVEAARGEAALAKRPQDSADAWVRSGNVNIDRLNDEDAGIHDFEQALGVWPDHTRAAERLIELLDNRAQHDVLVERLGRAASEATDPDRQSALWIEVARIYAEELGNLGGALSALQRLTGLQPKNSKALLQLGKLLASDRRFDEAMVLLDRALARKPESDVELSAHVLLAQCQEQSNDPKAAFRHYEAALALDPNDLGILRRIVDLQMSAGMHAEAQETAARLVEIAPDKRGRVEALLALARANAHTDRVDEAVENLATAVALEGPGGEACRTMAKLATDRMHWESYVEALRGHLQALEGSARAALYLEIARTQHERLSAEELALTTLIEGLRTSGGDRDLRFELGKRLRQAGRLAEAVEQFQFLLMDDVVRVEAWRYLAQTYEQLGRNRERLMAMAALAVLDSAAPGELDEVRAWQPRTGAIPPSAFVPGIAAELFVAAEQQAPAAALLNSMYDGLGKVRAADLNAYGVTGRDKVPTKVDHPMRAIVDRLAGVFGAEEFDLYMHRQRDKGVVIENTASRPSVLLPYWITELPHSQQVFLIAHAMLNLARGTHIIELFSPRDLEVLMTAAGRTAIPEFGGRIATSEVLDECQRQIARGIPRKKRKAFEASAEAYARSRGPDVGTFVQWAQQTARRVALIVADDLLAAVAVVARAEEMGDKKGVALVRASPIISDLLKVWVSKPAMMLRMRTGLIPHPTQE